MTIEQKIRSMFEMVKLDFMQEYLLSMKMDML